MQNKKKKNKKSLYWINYIEKHKIGLNLKKIEIKNLAPSIIKNNKYFKNKTVLFHDILINN